MTNMLTNLLASQVTNYLFYNDSYSTDQLKKVNYVVSSNGLFRVEKTPTAIFAVQQSEFDVDIPGLHYMDEGVTLLIPRIPFRYLQMALSFYREVYYQDGTEASLLFFWNKDNVEIPSHDSEGQPVNGYLQDGQLILYVPKQVNSAALSEFHQDPMVEWFRTHTAILCETHSHHHMDAFFSSTDDANENATQFYFVWGRINKEIPKFAFRYCSGAEKAEEYPNILFEWPMVRTTTTSIVDGLEVPHGHLPLGVDISLYQGHIPDVDFPREWLPQHQKKPYLYSQEASLSSIYENEVVDANYNESTSLAGYWVTGGDNDAT